MNYPPLPEPYDGMIDISGSGEMLDGFTADQMHAYVDLDRKARADGFDEMRQLVINGAEEIARLRKARATAEPRRFALHPENRHMFPSENGPWVRYVDRAPAASVAPEPTASQEYLLRAMARNYGDGPHQWDKLDRIACERAADEIKSLRAALSGAAPEQAKDGA